MANYGYDPQRTFQAQPNQYGANYFGGGTSTPNSNLVAGYQNPFLQQQQPDIFQAGAGAQMFGLGEAFTPVQASNMDVGQYGGFDFNGTNTSGGFMDGLSNMGAQGWGNIISAGSALGNMYFSNQALKQGKKEFAFKKNLAERNLANQAKLINTGQKRRARSNAASLGLQGDAAAEFIAQRTKDESVKGTV